MGNKQGYAKLILATLGLHSGQGAGGYWWAEADRDVAALLRLYPDPEALLEVARITSGKYWRATTLQELRAVYAEIDRLEKSGVKLPETVSRADLYYWPVLAAALLLLAEVSLAQGLLLRWP